MKLLTLFFIIFFSAMYKLFKPHKKRGVKIVYQGEYNPTDTPPATKKLQQKVMNDLQRKNFIENIKLDNQRQKRKRKHHINKY